MSQRAAVVAGKSFTIASRNPARERHQFFLRLRQFAEENQWSAAIQNETELILEEWITNVLSYGLRRVREPEVTLTVRADGNRACLEFRDNGTPFDPTTRKDPDINLPAEQRAIGGLGIFMIRKLSSSMKYERKGNLNVVVIEKDLVKPVLVKSA